MFGDARRAKKDVLADLVTLKHDVQTQISTSSLRKAALSNSEVDVKLDMQMIVDKLQQLMKVIHDNAKFELNEATKSVCSKVNEEILFLEDLYKSLDEMEQYIKTNTSNTNLKPLKVGKEKCEATRTSLNNFIANVQPKCAKFVIHPMLIQILENMESFSLGQTVVVDTEIPAFGESVIDEEPDFLNEEDINMTPRRENTGDPLRTSFIRSNSSKLITLPDKSVTTRAKSKPQLSRSNSTASVQSAQSSKQVSKTGGSKVLPSRTNSRIDPSTKGLSRQNSEADSIKSEKSESLTEKKKSKLITKRSNSNDHAKESAGILATNIGENSDEPPYRAIAGLRATLAGRSASAPILKLASQTKSIFLPKIKEEPPTPFQIEYRETMETKRHDSGCFITGIAGFPNGSVVVCDSVHDSLQLFDPEMKAVSEMECPHPWGVCAISDSAVAVSLHYSRKIILIKAAGGLERLNEKDIVLKCKAALTYDLKFYAYRLYALCIDGDIHVLDVKGREFSVIKTGMPLNTLRYFDIDPENELAVVSGEKGIGAISQGIQVWYFKTTDKPKMSFTGVLVNGGSILVCDWENHRLAELYGDGQRVRTVQADQLERPVVMSYVAETGKLFVSQGEYNMAPDKARLVKVFQMDMKNG